MASAAPGGIFLGWVREMAAEGDEAFQPLAPRAFFAIQTWRATRGTGEHYRISPCLDAKPDCRGRAANSSCAKGRCATCGEGSTVDWRGDARGRGEHVDGKCGGGHQHRGLSRVQRMLLGTTSRASCQRAAYRSTSRSRAGRAGPSAALAARAVAKPNAGPVVESLQPLSIAAPGVRPIKHACSRPPSASSGVRLQHRRRGARRRGAPRDALRWRPRQGNSPPRSAFERCVRRSRHRCAGCFCSAH